MNKKQYRAAMSTILSELIRQDRLVVVESFEIAEPKTKAMISKLVELDATNVLIVTLEDDRNVALSARNLIGCEAVSASMVNPVNLVAHDKVVMTADAVKRVQEWLS